MNKKVLLISNLLIGLVFIATTFIDVPTVNDIGFRVSMLIIISTSWNLMANAGLISLGHSAFWGVGSYVGLLATNAGIPLVISLILALIAGAFVGVLLAFATARLRGFFFAICTLGLSEGLRVTSLMLPDVTGGAVGIFLSSAARPSSPTLFLAGAIGAVATVLLAVWLTTTTFQYACRAMRSHEGAAQMLGIDPRRYRTIVIALAAALASAAGAINSLYGGYLDPSIAFSLKTTIESQIAPILGGLYTIAGPVVGSALLIGLSEVTRSLFGSNDGVSQLIYGAILAAAVLFMPFGLVGAWRKFRNKLNAPTRPAGKPKPEGAGV